MIKGSTYKRQQWKKKSLYSMQNNFTCNRYKGVGNWVNESKDIFRGNRRYIRTFIFSLGNDIAYNIVLTICFFKTINSIYLSTLFV